MKFQVPPARLAALERALGGTRQRLRAGYVDTPDRALARAGLALRVRREGRQWVQTLKGPAVDGMARLEHNVRLPGPAATVPLADPILHANTPAGEQLAAALAQAADPTLIVHYRTDIWRRTRELRARAGRVELAMDVGVIEAGARQLPVCEFEIELLSGSPEAVLATARRWVRSHGLWLDTRSKAERGDRLSRGETLAPARTAAALAPSGEPTLAQAWRAALQECFAHISANANQVAAGDYAAEHLHQLRVALRRLRSLQRFMADPAAPLPAWSEGASALFRRLGAARDRDAIAAVLLPRLQAALAPFVLPAGEGSPGLQWPAGQGAMETPQQALRDVASQMLLLDLLQALQPPSADEPGAALALREWAGRRLQRWQRSVQADIARFATLDDASRHRLRKRVKRLRYAAEWVAPLYPQRAAKRYLAALREAQDVLGEINDLSVALAAFRDQAANDGAALFACGWLAAQREGLLAAAPRRLKALRKAQPFWKAKG